MLSLSLKNYIGKLMKIKLRITNFIGSDIIKFVVQY